MMKYRIFQIKNSRNCDYSWLPWDMAANKFNLADYEEVYSGEMEQENILEELYEKFNIDHPADFSGHSMSTSDVIALKKPENDYWYWYYCDWIGWKEITDLINEMMAERRTEVMKNYDIVLKEKPLDEGLTKSEICDLLDMIGDNEVIPVEYQGEYSSAMGFISINKAAEIDYEYGDISYPSHFIQDILNDMKNENDTCEYECGTKNSIMLHIWLSR